MAESGRSFARVNHQHHQESPISFPDQGYEFQKSAILLISNNPIILLGHVICSNVQIQLSSDIHNTSFLSSTNAHGTFLLGVRSEGSCVNSLCKVQNLVIKYDKEQDGRLEVD